MTLTDLFNFSDCWVLVVARTFSGCSESGLLSNCGARASHCGGFSCCRARALDTQASVVVAHGFTCPVSCGILPDQGLNRCPLHYKADSQPSDYQESPTDHFRSRRTFPRDSHPQISHWLEGNSLNGRRFYSPRPGLEEALPLLATQCLIQANNKEEGHVGWGQWPWE